MFMVQVNCINWKHMYILVHGIIYHLSVLMSTDATKLDYRLYDVNVLSLRYIIYLLLKYFQRVKCFFLYKQIILSLAGFSNKQYPFLLNIKVIFINYLLCNDSESSIKSYNNKPDIEWKAIRLDYLLSTWIEFSII